MSPRGTGEKDQKSNKKSRFDDPRMLALVIQAVTDLNQSHGSTTSDIITQLKLKMRTSPRQGNSTRFLVKVRRALCNGVIVGLLEQHSGRYFICGIDGKSNESTKKKTSDENRNRLHSRSKSQSARTQGEDTDLDDCASSSATKNESSAHSQRRGGKRKKNEDKNKQKRKRTKRRRKSVSSVRSNSAPNSEQKKKSQPPPDSSNQQTQQNDNDMSSTSNDSCRHERVKEPKNDVRHGQTNENVMGNDQNTDEIETCDNSDCICNVLPEHQQPSREPDPACNTEETNDYIN